MFHGSMVAIITPMLEDKTIDYYSLAELIEWHIGNDTDAIVTLGTTGESATIRPAERREILKKTVSQVAGRIPIIAGTGTNSTAETIELTTEAMEIGVDACLLITPYYIRPTQHGLYQHYKAVAEAVAIPQILYNIPSRTGCDLLPETATALAEVANIIGLKEGTGDISRVQKILKQCDGKLDLYSGDDATALEFLKAGGKGVISVTANLAPQIMHEMCVAALAGDENQASLLQQKLMPLHTQLFIESNPIPVKWALQEMGKIRSGIRLPLTELGKNHQASVRTAMEQVGVV